MLSRNGPGIMCLIAAALPEMYLADSAFLVPSETIEFDCVGRMDACAEGSFANIEVGEIKSTFTYSSSVKQLGIRLAVLKYCYQSLTHDRGVVNLVGRVFLPKSQEYVKVDTNLRDAVNKTWGYTLVVQDV